MNNFSIFSKKIETKSKNNSVSDINFKLNLNH